MMYQRSSPEGCNSSDVDDTRSTTPRKTRPSSCQRAAAGATRPLAALLPIPTPMMMGGVGLGSIRSSMRGAFSCPPSHNGHGHQQPIRPFIPVHVHAQSCDTAASRAPVVNSTPPVPHVVRGRLRVDGGEMIMIGDSQEDCDQLTTTTDSDIIPEFELHVSSLPRGITQEKLLAAFEPFGEVRRCFILSRHEEDRVYGFVTFTKLWPALVSMHELRGSTVFGWEPLRINWSHSMQKLLLRPIQESELAIVYVKNLPLSMKKSKLEGSLRELCARVGTVLNMYIANPNFQCGILHGFIQFASLNEAHRAANSLNGARLTQDCSIRMEVFRSPFTPQAATSDAPTAAIATSDNNGSSSSGQSVHVKCFEMSMAGPSCEQQDPPLLLLPPPPPPPPPPLNHLHHKRCRPVLRLSQEMPVSSVPENVLVDYDTMVLSSPPSTRGRETEEEETEGRRRRSVNGMTESPDLGKYACTGSDDNANNNNGYQVSAGCSELDDEESESLVTGGTNVSEVPAALSSRGAAMEEPERGREEGEEDGLHHCAGESTPPLPVACTPFEKQVWDRRESNLSSIQTRSRECVPRNERLCLSENSKSHLPPNNSSSITSAATTGVVVRGCDRMRAVSQPHVPLSGGGWFAGTGRGRALQRILQELPMTRPVAAHGRPLLREGALTSPHLQEDTLRRPEIVLFNPLDTATSPSKQDASPSKQDASPSKQDAIASSPSEQDAVSPSKDVIATSPSKQDTIATSPFEQDAIATSPPEQDAIASSPSEQENAVHVQEAIPNVQTFSVVNPYVPQEAEPEIETVMRRPLPETDSVVLGRGRALSMSSTSLSSISLSMPEPGALSTCRSVAPPPPHKPVSGVGRGAGLLNLLRRIESSRVCSHDGGSVHASSSSSSSSSSSLRPTDAGTDSTLVNTATTAARTRVVTAACKKTERKRKSRTAAVFSGVHTPTKCAVAAALSTAKATPSYVSPTVACHTTTTASECATTASECATTASTAFCTTSPLTATGKGSSHRASPESANSNEYATVNVVATAKEDSSHTCTTSGPNQVERVTLTACTAEGSGLERRRAVISTGQSCKSPDVVTTANGATAVATPNDSYTSPGHIAVVTTTNTSPTVATSPRHAIVATTSASSNVAISGSNTSPRHSSVVATAKSPYSYDVSATSTVAKDSSCTSSPSSEECAALLTTCTSRGLGLVTTASTGHTNTSPSKVSFTSPDDIFATTKDTNSIQHHSVVTTALTYTYECTSPTFTSPDNISPIISYTSPNVATTKASPEEQHTAFSSTSHECAAANFSCSYMHNPSCVEEAKQRRNRSTGMEKRKNGGPGASSIPEERYSSGEEIDHWETRFGRSAEELERNIAASQRNLHRLQADLRKAAQKNAKMRSELDQQQIEDSSVEEITFEKQETLASLLKAHSHWVLDAKLFDKSEIDREVLLMRGKEKYANDELAYLELELELQVKGLKEKLELAKLETCALQLKTEYFL